MLNSSIFQPVEYPYIPLPEAASRVALEAIYDLNFPRNAILKDYSFASIEVGKPLQTNILAFAHPIHRNPEYAGITVLNTINADNDGALVRTLATSAALFHLIHHQEGNYFSLWASAFNLTKGLNPKLVETNISYEQLGSVLGRYAIDIKPQRIIDVKQGRDTFTLPIFRDMQPLQLTLWVADVTSDLLVDHFRLAVDELRAYARKQPDLRAYDAPMTALAIQLLGATILADTGVLDDEGDELRRHKEPLDKLIAKVYKKFSRYFQPDLFEKYYQIAENAYSILQRVSYAGFVPDMLTKIYTEAYSHEQRKKLGRFDTPLYLTRRIWENIPVEYLPPVQRHTADMTCGWGSFLISGHIRLSNLTDSPVSLRTYLHGNEYDPFTAQLAGLSLLLSTSEDSWHVDHGDALGWNWLDVCQPNIIVGNPPFGTTQGSNADGRKGWHEKANQFFNHAIERLAPNGYLAMLMPSSFISSLAALESRKLLLEDCHITELWELPIEVFPDATVQSSVVFAQKKVESRNILRTRSLQPNLLKNFKSSPIFTSSNIMIEKTAITQKASFIDYKLTLENYKWFEVQSHCVNLQEIAEIIKGASVGSPKNRPWKDYAFPKKVPWLTGVKKVMSRSFLLNYRDAQTITYPNDLERPRKNKKDPRKDREYLLAGIKVLLPYDPHPSWGKRNKVAIERKGHYVSDSFWVIVPTSIALQKHITHEVIAALLHWDVSNAWIVEHLKSPSIPRYALESIPVPAQLSLDECNSLTQVVKIIEQETLAERFESLVMKEAQQVIDTILKEAYHLDDATFERLRKISEWDRSSELTLDIQPDRQKADYIISGVVDSIDAEQGVITLWMEGFQELQTVQIVPSMPGWMLRPEAAFRTKVPIEYIKQEHIDVDAVDWGTFLPQPYAYLDTEELLHEFSTIVDEGDRNSVR